VTDAPSDNCEEFPAVTLSYRFLPPHTFIFYACAFGGLSAVPMFFIAAKHYRPDIDHVHAEAWAT